ncbi:hypothetical protein IFM46972_06865 [Aspergillus udagawae]|uniref:Uncharacterized protein n=1 Tax=Aspergillus udagawae TaxID=91492 RepID=A0A8H3P3T2_9EURO|nr:hypothetical protein IFM46972_06865 [Aspergillus udagawae]
MLILPDFRRSTLRVRASFYSVDILVLLTSSPSWVIVSIVSHYYTGTRSKKFTSLSWQILSKQHRHENFRDPD